MYVDIISPMFYVYKIGCSTKNEPQQQAILLGVEGCILQLIEL